MGTTDDPIVSPNLIACIQSCDNTGGCEAVSFDKDASVCNMFINTGVGFFL
jgi:hypothetical protein